MARRGKGEGSIFKQKRKRKDGTESFIWCGQISIGEGKIKRIYGKTRQEVSEELKRHLTDQQQGNLAEPNKITVSEYFDRWLNQKKYKNNLKKSTLTNYKMYIDNRIIPELGKIRMQKLNTALLNNFFEKLLKEGLNPKTVTKIQVIITNALKLAVKEGIISHNPAAKCDKPKQTTKSFTPLTQEEINKILEAAKKYALKKDGTISMNHNFNMHPAILLALYTGVRRGELLGLKWKYVDFENNTITIAETLLQTNDGIFEDTPKTDKSNRVISVPLTVMNVLQEHQKVTGKSEFVFANRLYNCIEPRNFNRAFQTVLKEAGITREIRVHDLRHSAATLLINLNINPKVIQTRLGHTDIRTTMNLYAHTLQEVDKQAAEKLDELLTPK